MLLWVICVMLLFVIIIFYSLFCDLSSLFSVLCYLLSVLCSVFCVFVMCFFALSFYFWCYVFIVLHFVFCILCFFLYVKMVEMNDIVKKVDIVDNFWDCKIFKNCWYCWDYWDSFRVLRSVGKTYFAIHIGNEHAFKNCTVFITMNGLRSMQPMLTCCTLMMQMSRKPCHGISFFF